MFARAFLFFFRGFNFFAYTPLTYQSRIYMYKILSIQRRCKLFPSLFAYFFSKKGGEKIMYVNSSDI